MSWSCKRQPIGDASNGVERLDYLGSCKHFVSAICRLNCRDRFGAFVSAPQNRVSRQRRPVRTAFSKISFEPSDFLPIFDYPKFHNEIGVPIVRIGCREFKCIGAKPPQDHPHIYLNMGDASEIVCPYCSTLFQFDPSLGAHEADPADCAYGDMD
jgi:uncharacterized Zn-finger protein